MAITMINTLDSRENNEDDVVFRQRAAARAKVDPKEAFKTEKVNIHFGPTKVKSEINLRWASGSRFIFAVFAENKGWQDQPGDVWKAASFDALQRFAAIHNYAITFGPRHEDTNNYNFMVEVRDPLP